MNEKNLPVPIMKTLAEYPHNFVKYRDSEKCHTTVYCQTVTSFNGYITMVNLRVKSFIVPSIDPIHQALCNHYDSLYTEAKTAEDFSEKGYSVIASKVIPEKALIRINSYDENTDLVGWSHTSEEEAVRKADEKVKAYNNKILKHNRDIFSNIVDAEIRKHFSIEYAKLIWIKLKFIKKSTWVEKQKKLHGYLKLREDKILQVKNQYQGKNIQHEGELEYTA